MILGCYYRCPVVVEEADESYPRFFVLAQVIEYNELADTARVAMHDLLGSSIYYSDIMENVVSRAGSGSLRGYVWRGHREHLGAGKDSFQNPFTV